MKTVFIASFHPLISRNILSTEILPLLERHNFRVVLLVPDYKKGYFEEHFGGKGKVAVEGVRMNQPSAIRSGLIFKRFFQMILSTKSVRVHFHQQILPGKSLPYRIFFGGVNFFGRWRWAPRLARFFDLHLSPSGFFLSLIDHYRPDLIFSTDVQNENDVALMQDAVRRSVPVVGMVRSWDNLTFLSLLRVVPDVLLVASETMKREAIMYHMVAENKIVVVGVPHRDFYRVDSRVRRKEFLQKIHADSAKKLIVYAPIGDLNIQDNATDRYVLEILSSLGLNVIVRFPPFDVVSNLEGFIPPVNMYFDKPGIELADGDYGRRELSKDDDEFLANSVFYSDVVVCGPSTIAIDAALFDKPVILVNFRKSKNGAAPGGILNYEYINLGYLSERGGVRMAKSEKELRELIAMYLREPWRDAEGRKRIVQELSGPQDGRASERVFSVLRRFLERSSISTIRR